MRWDWANANAICKWVDNGAHQTKNHHNSWSDGIGFPYTNVRKVEKDWEKNLKDLEPGSKRGFQAKVKES